MSQNKKLLVVDDDKNVIYSIRRSLGKNELSFVSALSASEGLSLFCHETIDMVILDVRLPDSTGIELMKKMKEIKPDVPIVVMTAYSAAQVAIEAIGGGAFDYLVKPVDLVMLQEVIHRATDEKRNVPQPILPLSDTSDVNNFVGQSQPMQDVYKQIGKYSRECHPVLILGETGTGKELAAFSIHRYSENRNGPFVAINCASIPESLLESELFGHEKGSFTGADKQKIGKFEQADKGTIFLDEIGEMSYLTQAKMLRIIQDQRFERIGGTVTISTGARIVAATNRDLSQMVLEGKFRGDLVYRLNCLTIRMPPLRDREGDIEQLVDRFIAVHNSRNPTRKRSMHPDSVALLKKYSWPGNVRELQNAVLYSAINSATPVILPESLPLCVSLFEESSEVLANCPSSIEEFVKHFVDTHDKDVHKRFISVVEKALIRQIICHCSGNQVLASNILGISRTTLRLKCAAYGISN